MEINPKEARQEVDAGALLLDVREPQEWEIVRVEGSVLMPMRGVPARVDELPKDRRILVLCHHGGRSYQVMRYLRAQGLDAVNVAGGIDVWAQTVDPSLPRY